MHTHIYTHTPHTLPLMRVLLFDVKSGSLAGSLYLGERGRLVPWGPKKGRECLEGNWGVTITPALQEQLLPHPRVPSPSPKEVALVYSEDSVTVSPFPEI